jgi:hypothetical protein
MSLIQLSRNDQIFLLRSFSSKTEEKANYLTKVAFDDDLDQVAQEFINGTQNMISDSCICDVLTDEEKLDIRQEMREEEAYESMKRSYWGNR